MTLDTLMEIVIDHWKEKRLEELHTCPKCKNWISYKLFKHVKWYDTSNMKSQIKKQQAKIYCENCREFMTLVLAGEWIKLWHDRYD